MNTSITIKIAAFILIGVGFAILVISYSNSIPAGEHHYFRWGDAVHEKHSHKEYQDSSSIVEKTFEVSTDGLLYINTDFANIQIESWDKNEVSVSVRKEGNERDFKHYNVSFSSSPEKVEIYGKSEKNIFSWSNFSVYYIIKVPKQYNFDIDNSAGEIDIKNVSGKTKINSSAGNIALSEINGDVDVDNSAGNIRLNSINGKIKVSESAGNIDAEVIDENKGVDMETSAGNIRLHLSENAKADLNCSSGIGNVDLDTENRFSGEIDGNDVKGKLNGGGNKIILKSSIGNIRISFKK